MDRVSSRASAGDVVPDGRKAQKKRRTRKSGAKALRGRGECAYFFFASVPSSFSLAAMSSAEVAGFTMVSMALIFPSLPI
jgi:hypothetical protein